jgi:phage nucleotide-binding protein
LSITLRPTENPTKPTPTKKREGAEKALALIKPASQIDPFLKICVYGRNGVGKTTFAASAPGRTLIIDCNERGSLAVRDKPDVDFYPVEYWDQLDWVYWYLKAAEHPYQTVAIDTITSLATLGMKWVLGDENARDPSRDPQMPDKRHWGKLGEVMKTSIINFRNLPLNVVFCAQERVTTVEDDESGGTIQEVHPELSPAPRSTLLAAVDIVGRLYVAETEKDGKKVSERRMLVGPHAKYVSKDRSGKLPRTVRNPSIAGFLNRIGGANIARTTGE